MIRNVRKQDKAVMWIKQEDFCKFADMYVKKIHLHLIEADYLNIESISTSIVKQGLIFNLTGSFFI